MTREEACNAGPAFWMARLLSERRHPHRLVRLLKESEPIPPSQSRRKEADEQENTHRHAVQMKIPKE
ncbi:MAG: hypothetical protein VB088_09040 [Sphaerochaeta sp.]|jgi:hypothetical protein|nr:hypothetical protein [Sphaerochaeta sp.]